MKEGGDRSENILKVVDSIGTPGKDLDNIEE